MFDRGTIKALAKARLNVGLGSAILTGLILTFLGVSVSVESVEVRGPSVQLGLGDSRLAQLILFFMMVLMIILLFYGIFVGNVIRVGCCGWFLRYWRGENLSAGEAFAGFRIYLPCVKTMLLRNVFVFLWSLLLIIPGIVKSLAYSMAEYIIYENPNLPADRALAMSDAMTRGYKGDIFVFELSFLGWQLLSGFTCGILGIVYVNPYYCTAYAGVYEMLKASAIQRGVLTWEDFGQYPPYQAPPAPPSPPYGYTY